MTDWTRHPAPLLESRPGVLHLPFTPSRVLVVSDLHLGPGQDAVTGVYWRSENFVADLGFQMFLRRVAYPECNGKKSVARKCGPLRTRCCSAFSAVKRLDTRIPCIATAHVPQWRRTLA